jgi:hypothetical protein
VLGGVYNGVDKPSPAVADKAVGSDGRIATRSFTSRKGHFLLVSDADGDEFVEIASKDSTFSVKVAKDAEGGAVIVASDNVVKIDAQGDITITSKGAIKVEAPSGELSLKGQTVKVEATNSLQVKGQTVAVEGTTSTEVKGARTTVKGQSMLDLDGGTTANLHAGMVRIN